MSLSKKFVMNSQLFENSPAKERQHRDPRTQVGYTGGEKVTGFLLFFSAAMSRGGEPA
jgi:hypothetical protein